MEKSKGHICFAQTAINEFCFDYVEFFERLGESPLLDYELQVFRAPVTNVIMPDGYRCGRWECSRKHFDQYKNVILGTFDHIIE